MQVPRRPGLAAVWMRGGAAKGLFLNPADLPDDTRLRDALLLRLLGGPDPFGLQLDGLGNGTVAASKVALVRRSARPDCDVDCQFGQVSVSAAEVDWSRGCADLTAAVAPYALEAGLLRAVGDQATVRIWLMNLGKRVIARVPLVEGLPQEAGDVRLAGVAGAGADIQLRFEQPGCQAEGGVWPSGEPRDALPLADGRTVPVSLVHVGRPLLCVAGASLDAPAWSVPAEVSALQAAAMLRWPTLKVELALLWPAAAYVASDGTALAADDSHVLLSVLSDGQAQPVCSNDAAMAVAVAAATLGTVVADMTNGGESLRIGHAAGVRSVSAELDAKQRLPAFCLSTTARRLMAGLVYP